MYEYRVIMEKDSTFGGKFDAEAIEHSLNEYARNGWRVVNGISVTNLKTFGGQVLFVLERSDSQRSSTNS